MTNGRPDQPIKKSTGEILPDMDSVLVEEFCSLVAEIAARALTRRHGGSHNETSTDGRR